MKKIKKMKQPYLFGDKDKVHEATIQERIEEVYRTLKPGFFTIYKDKIITSKKLF